SSDFFYQAEDGIRYFHVTGVQTCALPISIPAFSGDVHKPVVDPPFLVTLHIGHGEIASRQMTAEVLSNDAVSPDEGGIVPFRFKIGRASCRERVWKRDDDGSLENKCGGV